MIKIKVLKNFYDKKNNLKLRKADENFKTSESRAKQLIALGFAEKVEVVKTEEADTP